MNVRSLRDRLSQFDPTPTKGRKKSRPTSKVEAGRDVDSLIDAGFEWQGSPPTGYLRSEFSLEEKSWPGSPHEVIPRDAWLRLTGETELPPPPWGVIDTETTGLDSGTGTMVFLLGVVLWEETGAKAVQYFLPEPAAEARMWADVVDEFANVGAWISYNGKAFDLPRLRTRMALQRREAEIFLRPHLDLIHPCRRLARDWLVDGRLQTMEQAFLGHTRSDDLPGWEVPEVYYTYLVDGEDTGLDRVAEHNRWDIENLLRLSACISDCFLDRPQARPLPPVARFQLGRALHARGICDDASVHLERVVEEGDADLASRSRLLLSQIYRRLTRHPEAEAHLRAVVHAQPEWVDPHVELAKLLEHRLRDVPGATNAAEAALNALRRRMDLQARSSARDEEFVRALVHRLARLRRKAERAAEA